MSQKYLIRIAELERLLSEQAEALRQKDQQLSLVEETEAFLRSALTRAEEKIEEDEREIEHLRAQIEKLRRCFNNTVTFCTGFFYPFCADHFQGTAHQFQLFSADFPQIIQLTATLRATAFFWLQAVYFTGKVCR